MPKKKILSKSDIQHELLVKINKAKPLVVFLTIFTVISIISYIGLAINYTDIMIEYRTERLAGRGYPPFGLFIGPIGILFFIIFLLNFYYIDLYRVKKGKFKVIEEKLYQKEEEWRQYYKHSQQENSLYFRCGRVAVEDDVYSYSSIGDRFYVVILGAKKVPHLVYHTKHYEIDGI